MKATKTHALRYLVKPLPQPTIYIDATFKVVCASDSWLEYFDISTTDLEQKSIVDIFGQKEKTYWKNSLLHTLKGEKEFGIQNRTDAFGKELWFEWTSVPWKDENETTLGAIVQCNDITKKLENELKYEKIESLLKDQSEIAKIGIWEFDIAEEVLTWSEMTKKIHEVPQDFKPDIDTAINFYKQGHSRNTIAMLVHNGIHRGESWSEKLKMVTANGNEKWVISAGKPLYKEGKVTRLLGTFQDVTGQVDEQKKTEEKDQLLRTLVDSLPLNLYIKDHHSKKVLVNKAECEYLGVENPDEIIGKSDFELYPDNIAQISRDEDLEVMKTKRPILGKRTINVKKDGVSTSFLTSKIPLLDLDGHCTGLIGISMDISDIIQKENQLNDLINVTAIQNKKLINFAHIVSHNLRSHTANFSMLVDFLTKEEDETEKNRILDMLTKASDNLMDTLENLNEVVDIRTNVNLEKKLLNLNEQIRRVEENLAAFLQQNKVEIDNTISDKVYIKAVPAYLESIIQNLLTNAVKYKHPDRIPRITLKTKKEDNTIVFSILDNGLGIDLDKYGPKLFGMYKTFHNNPDARGIGLYITKNQVEAMRCTIDVQSVVNKGSKFSVGFKDEN